MKEYKETVSEEKVEKQIDGYIDRWIDRGRDGTVMKSMSEYSESFLVDVVVVAIPQNFSHQPPQIGLVPEGKLSLKEKNINKDQLIII